MSSSYAANLARWNAIPLSRDNEEDISRMKRSRSKSSSPVPIIKLQGDYDSSDEDDVSLVSRTPSPTPDTRDTSKYDEYHPAAEKEVITVETQIKSSNKGYAMLSKLGWTAGQPLGLSGDGRVDPIPFALKNDLTGLGKRAQDERMIETTVSQRRELDSERQIRETTEQRSTREQKAAEKEALANQIADTLKAFYCSLCDKQYRNVAQYDEHTNSYAHHHKQRFRDMQANAKSLGGSKQDKEVRLAKERKREEKELKRMAKARGVKVNTLCGVVAPIIQGTDASGTIGLEEPKPIKKTGWAAVATPIQFNDSRRAGWSTLDIESTSRLDTTTSTPIISGVSEVTRAESVSRSQVSSFVPPFPLTHPPPPPPPAELPPPPPPLPLSSSIFQPDTSPPLPNVPYPGAWPPFYSTSHTLPHPSHVLPSAPNRHPSLNGYDARSPSPQTYSTQSYSPSQPERYGERDRRGRLYDRYYDRR